MDSEIRRDRCGVCGGDSSTCKFVRKKWEEKCPGFGKLSDNINRFFVAPETDILEPEIFQSSQFSAREQC